MAVLTLVALAAGFALATQVFGHAGYDHSTPARDEVVAESPEQLDIYYAQDVRKIAGANTITVLDEGASTVNLDEGIVDDDDRTHVYTELPANLPPGRYIVQWTTLSDLDDEEDAGAFCFYVAVEPTAAQADECAAFDDEEEEPTATSPSEEPTEAGVATATQAGPTATVVAPSDGEGDDDGGVSSGVIIAIVAGVIVVVVAVGAAGYWLTRS